MRSNQHAAAVVAAALVAALVGSGAVLAVAASASFAILGYRARGTLAKLRPYGGYANRITVTRLLLVVAAAAWLADLDRGALLVLFGANVALDALDGYAARRYGQITEFGAFLDGEVDAFFVLTAYLYFFLTAHADAWILLPGLMPYLYRLAMSLGRDSPRDIPRQRHAVVLAGVNFCCLLAAVAAPPPAQLVLLEISVLIVLGSFILSFWQMYRHAYSLP